jgi:hypothetical protein
MRSMRFILWLALALGLVWGGYWFVGARAVKTTVEEWFAEQKAAGLVAETSGITVAGFADRFDMTVSDVHLADPVSGWGWSAPFAQVFAMTWKPWHLIAALPHMQEIALPDGERVKLGSSRMMASLLMRPTPALPPDRIVIEGETLALTSDAGWSAGMEKLVLAAENDPTRANTVHLGADVKGLTLPDTLAHLADLGPVIASLHVDTSATLSVPLDWEMVEPKVLQVTFREVHLVWGAIDLTATGAVKADANGMAEGKIDLAVKGWRSLPAVVVALGLVPPQNQVTVERGLEFMSKAGTDPDVVTLPLSFKSGEMRFGLLPLGAAPRLQ